MKIGVIGAGMISEIYLQNMTARFDSIEVAAIADLDMEKAKTRADQFGIPCVSVEELLADPGVEMIVNLTPVSAHYAVIKQALEAGKHVYTEKTIAMKGEQAVELCRIAEEKGLYLGSAPDTFLGSALQAARAAIDDGLIGEVNSFAVSANRSNELLLSFISYLRKPGIGVLLDYGVYYITALVSLFGPVKRIGAISDSPYKSYRCNLPQSPEFGQMIPNPNESRVSAILCMENGISGTFHIDTDSILFDQAVFVIYGTRGILYLSDPNQFGGEIKYQPSYMDPAKPVKPITLWQFTPNSDNSRGVGPAEMAEAIAAGRMQRTSKEMAAHVLEVLEQIRACGETGGFADIISRCERPAALPQKPVAVKNIGHITFQIKDAEGMRRFYGEVLGMKPLFVLTVRDLAASLQAQYGDGVLESLKPLLEAEVEIPWIEYFKLADHQFLEFFYDLGSGYAEKVDYGQCYGFKKVNYEVDDIHSLYERMRQAQIALKDEIHPTADGSLEFSVLDPDGNEIQFTQYTENTIIPIKKDDRAGFSQVKYTTQIALQIQDEVNMMNFYTKGLGLKKVFTFTYGMLAEYMEKMGADAQTTAGLKMMGTMPCIDYIEVAPHQYIEFFYCTGQQMREERDRSKQYGYQHFCLEVPDIREAWDAVTGNGIRPDTRIALGTEGSYQFWLTDPDGNKLELMQYTESAKQML